MKHFNSYDTDKFVVGKEYYTYYWEETNRGNAIKDYTGIMRVKAINNDLTNSIEFEILESKPLGKTIGHNIYAYMRGYGMASTNFFDTYEDCVEHHDQKLKQFAKYQNTKDRNTILKRLINKTNRPEVPDIETKSIEWYNTLNVEQQNYVKWIKQYYSEL